MPNQYESISINQAREALHVELYADTHVAAKPPFAGTELADIQARVASGELNDEALAGLTGVNILATEYPDGAILELNSDMARKEKVPLVEALTGEVMAIRGLSLALVSIHRHRVEEIILQRRQTVEPTVAINDDTDLETGTEEDRNDPEWQALLHEARAIADREVELDHQERHKDEVHVVLATDTTAVLRSPVSGDLHSVDLDRER